MQNINFDADAFRTFFEAPGAVASLMEEFVPFAFVKKTDFSTLERCTIEHMPDSLKKRFNGAVWRVRLKDAKVPVMLIAAFQHEIDPWMALRIQAYTVFLYQDLIRKGAVSEEDGLPPVFPMVLYTGRPAWAAPEELADLFQSGAGDGARQRVIPHQSYHLIDVNRIPEEKLRRCSGLAAQLFRLVRARSPEEAAAAARGLENQLRGSGDDRLSLLLTEWLKLNGFQKCGFCEQPSESQELPEASSMLAENLREWQDNYKREVRAEVRNEVAAEVRNEVRRKTLQNTILLYLEQRFGASLNSAQECILQISDPDILDDLQVSLWKARNQQEALEEIRKRVH